MAGPQPRIEEQRVVCLAEDVRAWDETDSALGGVVDPLADETRQASLARWVGGGDGSDLRVPGVPVDVLEDDAAPAAEILRPAGRRRRSCRLVAPRLPGDVPGAEDERAGDEERKRSASLHATASRSSPRNDSIAATVAIPRATAKTVTAVSAP